MNSILNCASYIVSKYETIFKDTIDEMKYAILRPNGHLYSRWDDKGSLIF